MPNVLSLNLGRLALGGEITFLSNFRCFIAAAANQGPNEDLASSVLALVRNRLSQWDATNVDVNLAGLDLQSIMACIKALGFAQVNLQLLLNLKYITDLRESVSLGFF